MPHAQIVDVPSPCMSVPTAKFVEIKIETKLPRDKTAVLSQTTMGSITTDHIPTEVADMALPAHYAILKTNGKRMIATLDEACTWGQTPDGGMSKFDQNNPSTPVPTFTIS